MKRKFYVLKFKDIENSIPQKDYHGIVIVNNPSNILNWPQSVFSMLEEEILTSHVNGDWALIDTDVSNFTVQGTLKAAAFLGGFDGKKVLFAANRKTADIFTEKTGIKASAFIGADFGDKTENDYDLVITGQQRKYSYTDTYSVYSKKISDESIDLAAAVIASYYVDTILLGLFNKASFSTNTRLMREEGLPNLIEAASNGFLTSGKQKKLSMGGIEEYVAALAYSQVCSRNDETATQIKQIETLVQLWDAVLKNSDPKVVGEIYKKALSPTDKVKKLASYFNIDLMLETIFAGVPLQDVVSDLG